MYFEENLPILAPNWLDQSIRPEFQKMLDSIHARMSKLERAKDLNGMRGEDFARCVKPLFDSSLNFDSLSADELAKVADVVYDGKQAEARVEWPNATVVVDTDFVLRHEWESLRHFSIGGSDAPVVMNAGAYNSAFMLAHTKRGTPVSPLWFDDGRNAIFDRGHVMEDRVVNAFVEAVNGQRIRESRMFASKRYPCCTANIDAIVKLQTGQFVIFEAKTTVTGNFMAWMNGAIPSHYLPQMRQYPAVLDDPRIAGVYIGCIFVGDIIVNGLYVGSAYEVSKHGMKVAMVERTPAEIAEEDMQLAEEAEWFATYVEDKEMPEMRDSFEKERVAIEKYLYNPTGAGPLTLNQPKFLPMFQKYQKHRQEYDAYKKAADAAAEEGRQIAQPIMETMDMLGMDHVRLKTDEEGSYVDIRYAGRKRTGAVDWDKFCNILNMADPTVLPSKVVYRLKQCKKEDGKTSPILRIGKPKAAAKR